MESPLLFILYILNRDLWILHISWHHLSLSLIHKNIPNEFKNGKQKKKTHKFYLCLSFLVFTFQNGSVSWKLFSCWESILFFCSVSLLFICFEPFSHKSTSSALSVQNCFLSHRPGIVQLQKVTVDFSQNLNPPDRAFEFFMFVWHLRFNTP